MEATLFICLDSGLGVDRSCHLLSWIEEIDKPEFTSVKPSGDWIGSDVSIRMQSDLYHYTHSFSGGKPSLLLAWSGDDLWCQRGFVCNLEFSGNKTPSCSLESRREVWPALGGCAVSSYSVLLPTLTILGRMNEAGIVFPVSCAISILLFSIFTSIRYKEKQTWSQKLAFASICAGILLVKLS